jgi:hypothetical protein
MHTVHVPIFDHRLDTYENVENVLHSSFRLGQLKIPAWISTWTPVIVVFDTPWDVLGALLPCSIVTLVVSNRCSLLDKAV